MTTRPLHQRLLAALARLAAWPLALLILFEEWGWEPLQQALARLGRWLGLSALEARIARLRPHPALAVLVLPWLCLIPVKVLALWLIGKGHTLVGLAVILLAKVLGTALVARLFSLTHRALMQLPWFASLYARWSAWKAALLTKVRAAWPWRWARAMRRRWRHWRTRARP